MKRYVLGASFWLSFLSHFPLKMRWLFLRLPGNTKFHLYDLPYRLSETIRLGEPFRLNGYKFPIPMNSMSRTSRSAWGPSPTKKYSPILPCFSDIPGTPPLSIRTTGAVNVNTGSANRNHTNNTDFDFPER